MARHIGRSAGLALPSNPVRTPIDMTLLAEIRALGLRFTCPDCLYQLPDGSCAHGWPNQDHRRPPDALSVGKELVFCKEFDLR
jgi:hypothetical protein